MCLSRSSVEYRCLVAAFSEYLTLGHAKYETDHSPGRDSRLHV